jgi:Flp pilus assembly protein TadG
MSMSRRNAGERGAAAVEFALVLPILLSFLFGVVEYGNFFMQDIKVSNAAMIGAREYAVGNTSTYQASAASQAGSGFTFTTTNNCLVSSAAADGTPGYSVTVKMTKAYTKLVGLIPTPSTLSGKGTVRCES